MSAEMQGIKDKIDTLVELELNKLEANQYLSFDWEGDVYSYLRYNGVEYLLVEYASAGDDDDDDDDDDNDNDNDNDDDNDRPLARAPRGAAAKKAEQAALKMLLTRIRQLEEEMKTSGIDERLAKKFTCEYFRMRSDVLAAADCMRVVVSAKGLSVNKQNGVARWKKAKAELEEVVVETLDKAEPLASLTA
jgi:hypothetical protein